MTSNTHANATGEKMKAWVFHKSGHPSKVLQLQEWPKPVPKKDELLIEVKSVAFNPVSYKLMSVFPMSMGMKKPAVPEEDYAGIVVSSSSPNFKAGDAVFGIVPADEVGKTGRGTLAQFAAVPAALAVHKPENLSFSEAACFPLAGLTAAYTLFKQAGLTKESAPSKRVFINGGSSGTGAWGVQLAKARGAYVATTCSPSSRAYVETLGADEVIDYQTNDLVKELSSKYADKPFDVIFDCAGIGSLYHGSPAYLKKDGLYLDIAGVNSLKSFGDIVKVTGGIINKTMRPGFLGGTPRTYKFGMFPAHEMAAELAEAAELLKAGTIKATIDSEFAFEDALKAYERQMSNRAKGKVVVKVA